MKHLLGDLRRSVHLMEKNLADFVRSKDFEDALTKTEMEEDAKAYLMVEALKKIALCPCRGETPEDFIFYRSDSVIAFNIQFDRWSNFIGLIGLPLNSGRAQQLIDAIETNLNSKMYKAAKMHRRLYFRRRKIESQVCGRARSVYTKVLERYRSETGAKWNTAEVIALADEEFDRIYSPRMKNVDERVRKVADVAEGGFRGAYPEAVANFLYGHLPILI